MKSKTLFFCNARTSCKKILSSYNVLFSKYLKFVFKISASATTQVVPKPF